MAWPRSRRPARRDGGFTLLEVLVAFLIAAAATGVLIVGVGDGLAEARIGALTQEALSHARSHLAAIGTGGAITAGEQSGDDGGGFHWRTRVAAQATTSSGGAQGPRVTLYAVDVTVDWGGGGARRSVTLDSQRLGVAAPPSP